MYLDIISVLTSGFFVLMFSCDVNVSLTGFCNSSILVFSVKLFSLGTIDLAWVSSCFVIVFGTIFSLARLPSIIIGLAGLGFCCGEFLSKILLELLIKSDFRIYFLLPVANGSEYTSSVEVVSYWYDVRMNFFLRSIVFLTWAFCFEGFSSIFLEKEIVLTENKVITNTIRLSSLNCDDLWSIFSLVKLR